RDPHGLEGEAGTSPGLGLLDITTMLMPEKQLRNVRGRLVLEDAPVQGYEIHAGVTTGAALTRPAVRLDGRTDGALSPDNHILGTYLHGLFESTPACDALLRWAELTDPQSPDYAALRETGIERLADAVESHLDLSRIERLLGLCPPPGRNQGMSL
ncbi:MAG: cobyric acid synthase, partial [Gammaproteobacteria bacterium]